MWWFLFFISIITNGHYEWFTIKSSKNEYNNFRFHFGCNLLAYPITSQLSINFSLVVWCEMLFHLSQKIHQTKIVLTWIIHSIQNSTTQHTTRSDDVLHQFSSPLFLKKKLERKKNQLSDFRKMRKESYSYFLLTILLNPIKFFTQIKMNQITPKKKTEMTIYKHTTLKIQKNQPSQDFLN